MIVSDCQAFKLNENFVVLEGVNGAGKSTLRRGLASHLRATGKTVVETFEPGNCELGKIIRPLALSGKYSPLAELFLFAADRSEHVRTLITPALNRGELVISDRYYYSTEVFQGFGRGLDREQVRRVNEIATNGVRPGLVILIDIDPSEGLKRGRIRDKNITNLEDNFELVELDFHRKVRDGFLELAESLPEPFLILDGMRSQDELLTSALKYL